MPEIDGKSPTADEERRVEELLRVNGELAAEIRDLRAKRTSGPRSAAMPSARRVGRLAEERDSLVAERDSLAAELVASQGQLEALKQHTDGLTEKVGDQARHIDELSHQVARLRAGAGGLLRRLLARPGRSPQPAPPVEQLPGPLLRRPEAQLRMQLDYALAKRATLTDDFFFVQIGAFDGRRFDPLFAWVRAQRWRGLLVEPQPRFFAELVENYRGQEGLEFRRVAVGVRNETRPFYTVADAPGVPRDAGMIASFDRETLLSHRQFIPDLDSHLRSEDIECVALNDLLAEADADHIDLLQIDVEGYDHELIRVLDFERFAPSIVRFEHIHLTPEQHEASIERLIDHGYAVCLEEHDTLACKASDLPAGDW